MTYNCHLFSVQEARSDSQKNKRRPQNTSESRIDIKIGRSGDLSYAPWRPKELEKFTIDAKNIIPSLNFHVEEDRQRCISQKELPTCCTRLVGYANIPKMPRGGKSDAVRRTNEIEVKPETEE